MAKFKVPTIDWFFCARRDDVKRWKSKYWKFIIGRFYAMNVYMLVDVASRGSILELRFYDNRFVVAVGWRLSLDFFKMTWPIRWAFESFLEAWREIFSRTSLRPSQNFPMFTRPTAGLSCCSRLIINNKTHSQCWDVDHNGLNSDSVFPATN